MDAKTNKKIRAGYAGYDITRLQETKAEANKFLAAPDGVSPEEIQTTKDCIEVIDQLIAEKNAAIQAEKDRIAGIELENEKLRGKLKLLEATAGPDADLQAENEELRARLATFEAQAVENAGREKLIGEKTRQGLTRSQAIAVIDRQKKHDEALEAQWATRRADIIKVLKTVENPREQRKQINELFPGIVTVEEINAAKKAMSAK